MSDAMMAELRSLLQAPKEAEWSAVLGLLMGWDDTQELVEVAVPYAHDIISHHGGPRHRRVDASSFLSGEADAEHSLRLAHIMTLSNQIDSPRFARKKGADFDDPGDVLDMLADTVHLQTYSVPGETLEWLSRQKYPNLATLNIFGSFSPEVATQLGEALTASGALTSLGLIAEAEPTSAFLERADLSRVHTLDLRGAEGGIDTKTLGLLLDAVSDGALRTVDLNDAWLEYDAAPLLATHPAMRTVEELDIRYNMGLGSVRSILSSSSIERGVKDQIHEYFDDIFE